VNWDKFPKPDLYKYETEIITLSPVKVELHFDTPCIEDFWQAKAGLRCIYRQVFYFNFLTSLEFFSEHFRILEFFSDFDVNNCNSISLY
jgi:hypothetical protein